MENHFYNSNLKSFARKHRNHSTKAEVRLWCEVLRNKQMLGFTFLRQRPIGPYIADFLCKELKLIIEADGDTHTHAEVASSDEVRTHWLTEQGYTVLRFTDQEIREHIESVRGQMEDWIVQQQ